MSESPDSVGLIGVGLLGLAIAERLLIHGFHVYGFDLSASRLAALASAGGNSCESVAGVVRACSMTVICLPHSSVARNVLAENTQALQVGNVLIDTTTGDPDEMIALGQQLRSLGADYLEATVAGSSEQMRSGNAQLFLGGDPAVIERCTTVLDAIAPQRFHLGPIGAASRFKLVHNLVLGLNRAALAEGLAFAQALGLEPDRALEILAQSPAASQVMETKGRKMVSGDRTPQARLSQHLKDVRLIVETARRAGLELPLSRAHQALLERCEALGFGGADNSAVIEAYFHQSQELK